MNGKLAAIVLCLTVLVSGRASAQPNVWTAKAPMPTARGWLGNGVVNGVLYAIGGDPGFGPSLGTVEAYNPATNAWSTKASMLTPRSHLGVGVVNGTIYAVGGYTRITDTNLATVEAYNPTTNMWTAVPPMPTARHSAAVAVVNGVLYAVGGYSSGGWLATVEAYDPSTNIWTTKAPMPTARGSLGVGVVDGRLYAVGGIVDSPIEVIYATAETYDPAANTWSTVAPMPTPRWHLAIAVADGLLYAVGGSNCNGSGCPLSTAEVYDAATNMWTSVAPMPTTRAWLTAGTVNGVVYAIGGSTCNFNQSSCAPTTALTTNEAFTKRLYNVCPLYDATKAVKSGIPIPIKLQLCDSNGANLSTSSRVVHATSITFISSETSGLVQDVGNANPDNDFRFDASLGSTGGYIFNLSTRGLATGSYNLNFTVSGDAAVFVAPFQVR